MTGPPPPNPGGQTSFQVTVNLPGATTGAVSEMSTAVQSYADFLANESQRQELSLRPAGSHNPELTANAVARARRAMSRYGERAKPGVLESGALMGSPVFFGAAGVMGGFLHSQTQVIIFAILALLGLVCIAYSVYKRVSS